MDSSPSLCTLRTLGILKDEAEIMNRAEAPELLNLAWFFRVAGKAEKVVMAGRKKGQNARETWSKETVRKDN